MMRKLFHNIHLWFSISFGLLITLVCFLGPCLVFEDNIKQIIHKETYHIGHNESLPIGQLLEKISVALLDNVKITGVTIPSENEGTIWSACRSLIVPRYMSILIREK